MMFAVILCAAIPSFAKTKEEKQAGVRKSAASTFGTNCLTTLVAIVLLVWSLQTSKRSTFGLGFTTPDAKCGGLRPLSTSENLLNHLF
jgi:peptidoglycan biosynthesis protein MviN/MurJ (putative lipid II flippase)